MLSLEPRHERCNIGARPFLERRRGFADIDETGDALSWPETDPLANVGMVGAPFRNPVRDIAHGMRGQHESLAAGARRKNLLPFGNGNGFAHAAHDPDDHRGSTEAFALGAQAFFADIRIVFAKALSQNLAHAGSRVAFDCADVFNFDPSTGHIQSIVLVYDTHPVRGVVEKKYP